MRRCVWPLVVLILVSVNLWSAEPSGSNQTWPQFLGPSGSTVSSGQNIPLLFTPEENLVWAAETPRGNSSPIIWDDKVFLTGHEGPNVMVLCYNRRTGAEVWRRSYRSRFTEDYFHEDGSPASPTSCTDGKRVVSCLGTYGLVAHDLNGNELWQREYDDRSLTFGTGSSPVIWNERVFVLRDTPRQSSLMCLDATTGKEIWVKPRRAAMPSFSTPYVWSYGDSKQVVVAGSGTLDAYDPKSGDHIWTVTGMPVFVCPTPVAKGDTLVFGAWATAHVSGAERTRSGFGDEIQLTDQELTDPVAFVDRFDANQDGAVSLKELPESRFRDAYQFFDADRDGLMKVDEIKEFFLSQAAPGRNVMVSIKAGGQGDITQTHVQWEATKNLPYVASPVIHRDRVYCLKKGGLLTSWDLETGKMVQSIRLRLGGEYYATPIIVDDKLVIAAERGQILVVSTDDKMKVLERNEIGENIYATPAVSQGRLYVRTRNHMFAFGSESSDGP